MANPETRVPQSLVRHGRSRMTLLGVALATAVAGPAAAQTGAPARVPLSPTVVVTPAEVQLNLFYRGATLHVQGWVPAGHGAAVLCSGAEQRLHLKRKGRVWGMWMNAGEVTFAGVPSVYLLRTSASLGGLAPAGVLRGAALGYDGLREQVARAQGTVEEDLQLFPELVRLKEHEGVFQVDEGSLRLVPAGHGLDTFTTAFFLPARVPPAAYEVRLYTLHDHTVEQVSRATTILRPSGVAAFITATAKNRGLLYGIVAVLVAMAAGLLTGLLFGLGGKRGHAH